MDDKLMQFIDHAQDRGLDHATIRQLLMSAGWKDKDIAAAFCTRELELPIPKPPGVAAPVVRARGRSGSIWPRRARDAFLHLLTFGALYASTTSVILLFSIYIDFSFPDPARRTGSAQLLEAMSVVRAALAVLIVTFPVFLFLWHYLLREARRQPDKGAIRRWVGYLSIFIGALTLVADVIALIYLLLEGLLTIRLLLQAAVLFLIAGGLVLYLVLTLRSESEAEK